MITRCIGIVLFILSIAAGTIGGEILFTSDFSNGDDGWKKEGKAELSPVSRFLGGKSLKIRRDSEDDDNTPTSWISPVIKTGGGAVEVGFWAADNYLVQPDFTYAAAVSLEQFDRNDNPVGILGDINLEWDSNLQTPYLWGKRVSDALHWKYYEYVVPKGIERFRLRFTWPKPLVRGTCYLADVRVVAVSGETSTGQTTEESPYRLLLSTPAPGGLFYLGDHLRFDALIYAPGMETIGPLSDAVLNFKIRDFQKNTIAEGALPVLPSAPVTDASFYAHRPATKRAITRHNNLLKRVNVAETAAAEPGRLFSIHVSLVVNGKTLAEDAMPYGVVEYFDYTGLDLSRSRFYTWTTHSLKPGHGPDFYDATSKFAHDVVEQNVFRKVRSVRTCMFNYDWSKDQPEYPGPIAVTLKLPAFPVTTYMPNIEQVPIERVIPLGAQGKKGIVDHRGRTTVDYDVDAYVRYIIEFIRVNDAAIDWVVPAGLERPLTERAVDLHKKAYDAIKKNFPNKKVGVTIYGKGGQFDDFKRNRLYECADFINTHLYASRFDLDGFKRLKSYYENTLKKPFPPLTTTECSIIAGSSQLNQSAAMLSGVWELMEHGFVAINYYTPPPGRPLENPDIEDTLSGDLSQSGYSLAQLTDRPVMASEIVMTPRFEKLRWHESRLGGGWSVMPLLRTMTYYNMLKDFDWTVFRKALTLGKSKVYIFDAGDSTRCGLETSSGFQPETLLVECDVPYVYKDMFGKTVRVTPVNGRSVIQLPSHPATLIFDRIAPALDFKLLSGGLAKMRVCQGESSFAAVDLAESGISEKSEVLLDVFGANRLESSVKAELTRGGLLARPEIKIPADARTGTFPMRVLLKKGDMVFAVLESELTIENPLETVANARAGAAPGLAVGLRNKGREPLSGKVVFRNRLTMAVEPEKIEQGFSLDPDARAEVFFAVAPELAVPNFNEKVEFEVVLSSGEKITRQANLFFRSCMYTEKPIAVDGDLSDWPLDRLPSVKTERIKKQGDVPARDDAKPNAQFYTMWSNEALYMAVVVKDATPVSRSMDVNLWMDDNILLGIYPRRLAPDDTLVPGYYREHIGLLTDGNPGWFRVEGIQPPNGHEVKAAVKRFEDGYVYELAYPAAALAPLRLEPGNGFRLSLSVFDADGKEGVKGFHGDIHFFGGANVNWAADPRLWYEFVFTKGKNSP